MAAPGPDAPTPAEAAAGIDLSVVVAEVYEEVERRRRSGEVPVGLERELDAAFARYAPPGAVGDDPDVLLARAEQAAFIDPDVPTASANPVARLLKQAVRKLTFFYEAWVAQQVTTLGNALARAARMLDRRVARLERSVPGANPHLAAEVAHVDGPDTLATYGAARLAAAVVAAAPAGRVVHATCAGGALVGALRACGVDAYGVEPRRALLAAPARAGLDVRPDDPVEHLAKVAPGALGGVVLTGVVERSTAGALVEVADLAARALRPGGALVVLSATPGAWAAGAGPVLADLSPGRPLHEETWRHLLAERGFDVRTGDPGVGAYLLVATKR